MDKLKNSFIKNIIFDLGGVIIDIDFQLSINALKKISPLSDLLQSEGFKSPLFLDYEKGLLSDEEFRNEIKNRFQIEAPDSAIDEAWNALLGPIPQERIDILQKLKPHFRTFLLSNTNAIHIEGVEAILYQSHGIPKLDDLFEKAYYSHHIKERKPDPASFLYILETHGLKAEETLFLDDNLDNIHAAESLGIQVLHIQQNSNDILKLSLILEEVTKNILTQN